MVSIAVTGAAGAVGRRVVERLSLSDQVTRIVAVDRVPLERSLPDDLPIDGREGASKLWPVQADLGTADPQIFEGCRSIVHLAEDGRRRSDTTLAAQVLTRVLDGAAEVGCRHVVLLSSALVYGAHADNPVPITESHAVRPVAALPHAMIKARLEEVANDWAAGAGAKVATLRPTATLSEGDSSWIGAALRAATSVRPDQVDPPVQFLHHEDLAAAVSVAVDRELDGVFNVAPDGWIGAETFRDLRGETSVRLPEQVGDWPLKMAKTLANRRLLDGLEPYVRHPWVVSNDLLRRAGWEPGFSNEEAFVAGTPRPLLSAIGPRRRQELALGAVSAAGLAASGAALWLARRIVR